MEMFSLAVERHPPREGRYPLRLEQQQKGHKFGKERAWLTCFVDDMFLADMFVANMFCGGAFVAENRGVELG